jgi:hypothetical protein
VEKEVETEMGMEEATMVLEMVEEVVGVAVVVSRVGQWWSSLCLLCLVVRSI